MNIKYTHYIIYGILALLFCWCTRFSISTPDTFNYLLITEQLAAGECWEAVSTHWGVGIAVLMLPLFKLGVDPILVFKLTQVLVGFFCFHFYLKIIYRLELTRWLFRLAILIGLVLILDMTLELTADLLLVTLLLGYFYIISDKEYLSKQKGWLCGLFGGLAYLSKAYAFPFFVVHFLLWNIFLLLPQKWLKPITGTTFSKKSVIKNMLSGFLIFLTICSIWAIPLSYKFDEASIGMAGKYNLALISPQREHRQLAKDELIDPQTEFTSYWAYEEPALFVHNWSPFESQEDLKYYINFLWSNVIRFCYIDYARHLVIFILISSLFIGVKHLLIPSQDVYFLILSTLSALIFTGGYFLVLVRERYFWLDYFLGLFVLFLLLKYIAQYCQNSPETDIKKEKGLKTSQLLYYLLITGTTILLCCNSIKNIYTKWQIQPIYQKLHSHVDTLKPILSDTKVAANDTWGVYHHTDASVYMMYHLRFRFWGQIKDERLGKEGLKEVQEKNIEYFILWDNPKLEQNLFKKSDLILEDERIRFSVYKIAK